MFKKTSTLLVLIGSLMLIIQPVQAGDGTINIDTDKLGAHIPRSLYGVFFEEISHAGEGGLYGELIQNRGFEDANVPPSCLVENGYLIPPRTPHFWIQPKISDWKMRWEVPGQWPGWSLRTSAGGEALLDLVETNPLNQATPHSLQINISRLPENGSVAVVNGGFWGVSIKQGSSYKLSFFARSNNDFRGPITASLVSKDGRVLATNTIEVASSASWKKYESTLTATGTDAKAEFALTFGSTGTIWLDFVSLFPSVTFKNHPNGLRPDIAQMIAELKPAFIRWPGGCFVEGLTVETRAQWKRTLGPIEERPGTYSPWGYWSSDGFGYHEFLQFSEDIGADALYVVNVGVSCAFRSGTFLPDDQVPALIEDTLEAIEYAIGPVTSKWGAVRARNGHPRPFPLKYIEVGNEQQGTLYGERVARFYEAIKARYPEIKVALSSWIAGIDRPAIKAAGKIDIVDEHAYKPVYWAIENFDSFAHYQREGWDLYIGEFATNGRVGRGNLLAALNDSVYMMSMEKNSDLVKMGSYAPLLENTNKRDWQVNLIHFDSSRLFGRAAYYACKLFAENLPSINLATNVEYKPTNARPISGGIGLGTFNTSSEFKDIRVEREGKILYKSDFSKNPEGWKTERGTWVVQDGAYRQSESVTGWSYFGSDDWNNTDVSLKARKLKGAEGFAVSVGNAEGRRVQWNVGGWDNKQHAIQAAEAIIGKSIPGRVEEGRWYDLRIEVRDRHVRCYLDGQLIQEQTLPRVDTVLAIAGKDNNSGEIVLKVVNTGPEVAQVAVQVNGGTRLAPEGKLTLLTSTNPTDENSFEAPKRIAPVTKIIGGIGSKFTYEFVPYSLSIIRLKTR